jgi:hypothetical protein
MHGSWEFVEHGSGEPYVPPDPPWPPRLDASTVEASMAAAFRGIKNLISDRGENAIMG